MEKKAPGITKENLEPQLISLRYACGANGNQVGLSHYLMATTGKKN